MEAVSQPACCVEECGLCGGSGCAEVGGVNSNLTANDCCSTEILESDVFCVDTGVAPCILTAGESSLVCHLSTLWRPVVRRKRIQDFVITVSFVQYRWVRKGTRVDFFFEHPEHIAAIVRTF